MGHRAGFTYSKGNKSAQYNFNSMWNTSRTLVRQPAYTSTLTSSQRSLPPRETKLTVNLVRLLRWNNGTTRDRRFLQSSEQGINSKAPGSRHRALSGEHRWFHVFIGRRVGLQRTNYQQTIVPSLDQRIPVPRWWAASSSFSVRQNNLSEARFSSLPLRNPAVCIQSQHHVLR